MPASPVARYNVLGVGVSALTFSQARDLVLGVRGELHRGYICLGTAHGLTVARRDPELRRIYNESWLTTPDGMPLVWLGFPVPVVFATLAINLLYQFWLHTELIGRLPRWIEWTFNTPTHHRVHHASNPEYLDCNYGGVLIIFDRLFGTFRAPRADVAMRYGLTEPLATYNPLRIAFHAWAKLYVDLRVARGWLERCQVLAGPPGFIPAARRIAAAQPAAVDAAVASGGAGGSTICR